MRYLLILLLLLTKATCLFVCNGRIELGSLSGDKNEQSAFFADFDNSMARMQCGQPGFSIPGPTPAVFELIPAFMATYRELHPALALLFRPTSKTTNYTGGVCFRSASSWTTIDRWSDFSQTLENGAVQLCAGREHSLRSYQYQVNHVILYILSSMAYFVCFRLMNFSKQNCLLACLMYPTEVHRHTNS